MKATFATACLATLLAGSASAEVIGVSIQNFDDNYQTILRNAMSAKAETLDGVTLQIEDAQRDIARQQNQVNNFIAAGVDAIIVTLADSAAAPALSQAAAAAGIPLVYVNLEPINRDTLPDGQAYVGSKETDAGRLGGEEACRLLKAEGATGGNGYVLIGDLAHTAALDRTQSAKQGLADAGCDFIRIVDEQQAGWARTTAVDLMTNWLTAGEMPKVVFANNDEMAIGAAQALRNAGISLADVVIIGVDATRDGLAAMAAGDMDATVFQNAGAQAAGAVDAAVALARGGAVEKYVDIPFELVTPANMADYANRN